MTTCVRRVHCTRCHPEGGDIERDNFEAYALVHQADDGAGVDEILLIKARLNHIIDEQLLFSRIIDITPPDDGDKH